MSFVAFVKQKISTGNDFVIAAKSDHPLYQWHPELGLEIFDQNTVPETEIHRVIQAAMPADLQIKWQEGDTVHWPAKLSGTVIQCSSNLHGCYIIFSINPDNIEPVEIALKEKEHHPIQNNAAPAPAPAPVQQIQPPLEIQNREVKQPKASISSQPIEKKNRDAKPHLHGSRNLDEMLESGCSDVHLSSQMKPKLRKDGDMCSIDSAEIMNETMFRDVFQILCPDDNWENFWQTCDTDFAFPYGDKARFRVNLFMDSKDQEQYYDLFHPKFYLLMILICPVQYENLLI